MLLYWPRGLCEDEVFVVRIDDQGKQVQLLANIVLQASMQRSSQQWAELLNRQPLLFVDGMEVGIFILDLMIYGDISS